MLYKDSPLRSSLNHKPAKISNHESPITKLTNLTQMKNSNPQVKQENVLVDRSNEIFMPQNAQKLMPQTYERKANREKQIEEIRKKYYQNSESKVPSQKYDRYEYSKMRQNGSDKRDENMRQVVSSQRRQALFTNRQNEAISMRQNQNLANVSRPTESRPITITTRPASQSTRQNNDKRTHPEQSPARGYAKTKQSTEVQSRLISSNQRQIPTSKLQRISQASNSNYETVTKTLDTLSPQRHRVKSSYVFDDRSNKRKVNETYIDGDNWRNRDSYHGSSIIKETTSIYNDSLKGSAKNDRSPKVYLNQRQISSKLYKPQTYQQRIEPKPFTIQDSVSYRKSPQQLLTRPQSRDPTSKHLLGHPTIYDNYLPKSYGPEPTVSSTQKSQRIQDSSATRPRHYTQEKREVCDKVRETFEVSKIDQHQKSNPRKRVLHFEEDEKIKEIQRRLKERQTEFKRRQENLKAKCDNNDPRQYSLKQKLIEANSSTNEFVRSQKPSGQQRSTQEKQNVDRQIERLSQKIKQFQDRKKQLNITVPHKTISNSSFVVQSKLQTSTRQAKFQDARKALQDYRQETRGQSQKQIYEVHEYKIKSNGNEQIDQANNEEEISKGQRQYQNMQKQKQLQKRCDFIQNTKPMYSERTLPYPARKQQSSKFAFQLVKIDHHEHDDDSSATSKITVTSTSSKTNSKQCKAQFQLHKRADEGMEQRKKRLQQNSKSGSTQQMKRLVSLLSQQSALDQQFRNCKIWFQNNRQESKWKQLKRILNQINQSNYLITELKDGTIEEFHISEDENNPFFSINHQAKFTYETLVKSFLKTKQFWESNILKQFDKVALKAEGFVHEKLDLEKKGFINLEDFVRFLNFESGNFYRNRDLVLIFKRFMNQTNEKAVKTLTIEKMLNLLSN